VTAPRTADGAATAGWPHCTLPWHNDCLTMQDRLAQLKAAMAKEREKRQALM
jgi:hypothetical protein